MPSPIRRHPALSSAADCRPAVEPTDTLEWVAARAKPTPPNPRSISIGPARACRKSPSSASRSKSSLPPSPRPAARVHRNLPAARSAKSRWKPRREPSIRAADAAKFRPETRGTADHSLPLCLALALIDGNVTLAQFEHDRWRDADIMAMVAKTTQHALDTVAARLNSRPRKSLDFATPEAHFSGLVATLSAAGNTSHGGVRSPASIRQPIERKMKNARHFRHGQM